MNPGKIELAGGSMEKAPKQKIKARRRQARGAYITVEGKRVKTTVRGARIHRLVRKAFKGLEIPPR